MLVLLESLRQSVKSTGVVVGHQMCDAVMPAAMQAHPDIGVRLDVLHILRLLTELRDEPELVADPAAAQRGAPRFTRLPPRRLEQRLNGKPPHQRVGDPSLKGVGDAVT